MSFEIRPLPAHGPLFEGAIAVYAEAFSRPPYSDPDRGSEVKTRLKEFHRHRPGYHALAAVADNGAVMGMSYGYRGAPGQWWHDMVHAQLPRDVANEWLASSYELVEVAVHPDHQAEGIGTALIRALLADREEQTCVLSTRTDSRAHNLYRRLGFEVLVEMVFAPRGALFYVMGKRLT